MSPPSDKSSHSEKAALRRKIRLMRNELPAQQRISFDRMIRQNLFALVNSEKPKNIGAYWPFNGEPDLKPLYRQLLTSGHKLALPVISEAGDHTMSFHAWHDRARLEENGYGICEPKESDLVPVSKLDMLFMPLVAYDGLGNRLGMGGGYYDRYLEAVRDLTRPLRLGIAYSLQKIETIEQKSWDIPVHGIVNELGCFTFTA
jgi:5-formyltetrahydrofolate cyclo-ligase